MTNRQLSWRRLPLLCVLLILFSSSHDAWAQVNHGEQFRRLSAQYAKAGKDQKLNHLIPLLEEAGYNHVDSVLKYGQQGLSLLAERTSPTIESQLYTHLSEANLIRCRYTIADSFAQKALLLALPGSAEEGRARRVLAHIYFRAPNAPQALLQVEQAMTIFDSLDLPQDALRTQLLLQPMLREDDALNASESILDAIDRAQECGNQEMEKRFLLHLGFLHMRMGNAEEGLRIVEELRDYFNTVGDHYYDAQWRFLEVWALAENSDEKQELTMLEVADRMRELGDLYHEISAYAYASLTTFTDRLSMRKHYAFHAAHLADSLQIEVPRVPLFQSWHYMDINQDSAIMLASKTYYMADLWGRTLHKFQAAENLTWFYIKTGNTDSANAFFYRYRLARFALYPQKNTFVSGRIEQRMASEKLLAEQAVVAEQREALKDAELKQQSQMRNILVGAIVVLLLVAAGVWRAYVLQKRTRQLIEEQKNSLERMDRLNREVFSVIAHDFKGPLITMKILADNLQHADLSQAELLQTGADLHQQAHQTQLLLENLLNWARAELKVSIDSKPESQPANVCEEIKHTLTANLESKQLSISNELPAELSVNLHADVLRIVFRNLISNAVKFSHPGQEVKVEFDAHRKAIQIIDQGIGINEETRAQLFSRTVASSLGTADESGFGLGLYICRELLRKSGWEIEAVKRQEQGTCITFYPLSTS